MLTRLKVSGFKNLIDVDVYFGPFTCIAGANGVGKSNLFDAIKFLSALADRPFVDAALSVRDEYRRASDIRSLFHRVGDEYDKEMSFEAEMIVAPQGVDDLGQEASASITFLRYAVTLAWRGDDSDNVRTIGPLELIHEQLEHINLGDAKDHLPFPHDEHWRRSAVSGRRASEFISTVAEGTNRQIRMHQDGKSGRALSRLARSLPRTVLSVASAAESPTALLARREMQSWRLLQLEPSALRKPDELTAPARLSVDGSHLPATLYHLAKVYAATQVHVLEPEAAEEEVYGEVANRLSELIDDVQQVWVERDERRELLTLYIKDRSHTEHPARALSDGTLRFLALTVLQMEPGNQGVICLEEPENGIHPERIPAMLELLRDIATNVFEPISESNPLRQVIINTHSPAVVAQVHEDSLLVAKSVESLRGDRKFTRVSFGALSGTWRVSIPDAAASVSLGTLLGYLNPIVAPQPDDEWDVKRSDGGRSYIRPRRVADRKDLRDIQPSLPFDS